MQTLKEEVRNAIVQAASAEFRQHGYMEASMRRIAAAAGMTTGNIYRYFRGKEELFDCLVGPVYEQYSQYAQEYLQTADIMISKDEASKTTFLERVQTTLVGLLKASGSELMLLVCRSEGSKYGGIKLELIHFTESLLLVLFSAAKKGNVPLSAYEKSEANMLSATMIESVILIIGKNDDPLTLGKLIDRLIAVYGSGIDKMLEEYNKK